MPVKSHIAYRAVLCRFSSEIPLKSERYQSQILKILRESIMQMCRSHQLTLQSLLPLSGRIICFFPSEQISRALHIFRTIVGIESISPVVSSSRKIHDIASSLLQFFTFPSCPSQFSLTLHSVVKLAKPDDQFLRDIIDHLQDLLANQQIPCTFRSQARFRIEIEIRHKGVYLFQERYPGFIGGFPIETKNVLMIPWIDLPVTELSALLLVRRGVIITPCIFHYDLTRFPSSSSRSSITHSGRASSPTFQQLIEKHAPGISKLATFYPFPFPVLMLPAQQLFEFVTRHSPPKWDQRVLLFYCESLILEFILARSRRSAFLQYNNRKMHFKGIAFPFLQSDRWLLTQFSSLPVLTVFPLVAFTSSNLSILQKLWADAEISLDSSISAFLQQSHSFVSEVPAKEHDFSLGFKLSDSWAETLQKRYPKYSYGSHIPSFKEMHSWTSQTPFVKLFRQLALHIFQVSQHFQYSGT